MIYYIPNLKGIQFGPQYKPTTVAIPFDSIVVLRTVPKSLEATAYSADYQYTSESLRVPPEFRYLAEFGDGLETRSLLFPLPIVVGDVLIELSARISFHATQLSGAKVTLRVERYSVAGGDFQLVGEHHVAPPTTVSDGLAANVSMNHTVKSRSIYYGRLELIGPEKLGLSEDLSAQVGFRLIYVHM